MDINSSNIISEEQLKWEISKKIQDIESAEQECCKLHRKLDELEDSFCFHNNERKALDDSLWELASGDLKLQELLQEREDIMKQRISYEEILLAECRDAINHKKVELENGKEEYQKQIKELVVL